MTEVVIHISGETGPVVSVSGETPENSTVQVGGLPGVQGKSAYEVWLSEGNQGSPQDFFQSITNGIGGYQTQFNGMQENDLIAFQGGVWVNRNQEKITDGGNF
jgi:hypothetical protein